MQNGSKLSGSGAAVDEEEWEDEEDWKDMNPATPDRRYTLPEGWMCQIQWERHGRFQVSYKTDDGAVLQSVRQLKMYLEGRPDLDSKSLLGAAKFSQGFARMAVLQHNDPTPQKNKIEDGVLEGILKQGGELNFAGIGLLQQPATSEVSGQEGANLGEGDHDTAQDEAFARRLQEEELQQSRYNDLDDEFTDDDEDYSDSDDVMGEVAAGGWRRRAMGVSDSTANDEDIACLHVKKVSETDTVEGHCPICQEVWNSGDDQRVLPCGHGFHPICIDRWLRSHKAECPLCKKDIREEWSDEDEEIWDPITGTWVHEKDSDIASSAGDSCENGKDEDGKDEETLSTAENGETAAAEKTENKKECQAPDHSDT